MPVCCSQVPSRQDNSSPLITVNAALAPQWPSALDIGGACSRCRGLTSTSLTTACQVCLCAKLCPVWPCCAVLRPCWDACAGRQVLSGNPFPGSPTGRVELVSHSPTPPAAAGSSGPPRYQPVSLSCLSKVLSNDLAKAVLCTCLGRKGHQFELQQRACSGSAN